ncbi:MAG TPA: ACP S-malonyltransferase [Solirubrobacterales bacterium]|jgi:malonyl CoA-acyl carrier protein transacylase|nr:ACP S-malonyltransferase [Solirubrobacterales bacterium]
MAAVTAAQRPDLLAQARAELGADPFELIGEGTGFAQPAIFCASLAHWKEAGSPAGDMVAGHSLGELAALVAGGALADEEGMRLAVLRGRFMEEASAASPGGMIAVLGGEDEAVRELAAGFELTVANDNAPGQLVLSGAVEALGEARRRLRADGVKAIRLPVAGAFHSPFMAAAATRFRAALDAVDFRPPSRPVFSSTAAEPFADLRDGLAAALSRPVLWRRTVRAMRDAGAASFLEAGPGDVLTGLVRRTLPGVEVRSLAIPEPVHA